MSPICCVHTKSRQVVPRTALTTSLVRVDSLLCVSLVQYQVDWQMRVAAEQANQRGASHAPTRKASITHPPILQIPRKRTSYITHPSILQIPRYHTSVVRPIFHWRWHIRTKAFRQSPIVIMDKVTIIKGRVRSPIFRIPQQGFPQRRCRIIQLDQIVCFLSF